MSLNGCATPEKTAKLITLSHDDPTSENSLDAPDLIVPRETRCEIGGSEFGLSVPADSFTVLRLKIRK